MRKLLIPLLTALAFVIIAASTGCEETVARNVRASAAGLVSGLLTEAVNAAVLEDN